MNVPLTRPNPPRLSEAVADLAAIEARGYFSNFGPVNTAFEAGMLQKMFGGVGACTTVCNATIGLMMAVQQAIGARPTRTRYALMPAFTFAAAAHAAIWCGLTPLFCDIDPDSWAASPLEEERLIAQYGDDIAVIMPYATFGFGIDLVRYEAISARAGIPVVVDAAASLGTIGPDGLGFGTGFSGAVVFSMHATKSFATGEAGLIYSADAELIRSLRAMANFGFGAPRSATMLGINGKLSEVGALLGLKRLDGYDEVMTHRSSLARRYRAAFPELRFQPPLRGRQAHQFASCLLPAELAANRADIIANLASQGIGAACYFSPHLMQQPFFMQSAIAGPLPVTDDVGARVISLPLFDTMTREQFAEVAHALRRELTRLMPVEEARDMEMPLGALSQLALEQQALGRA